MKILFTNNFKRFPCILLSFLYFCPLFSWVHSSINLFLEMNNKLHVVEGSKSNSRLGIAYFQGELCSVTNYFLDSHGAENTSFICLIFFCSGFVLKTYLFLSTKSSSSFKISVLCYFNLLIAF